MSEYSPDKSLRHMDRLAILQAGGQPYPVHVQLIISDYCNQNCGFCAYRSEGYSSNQLFRVIDSDGETNNNPLRMIPWPKLAELVEDFAAMGVKAVQLTGGGEPTLHPQFDELCELILSRGISLAVVTNGLLLKPQRAELLAGAAWVRVSVDCSNAESYGKIRQVPPQEFEIVARNIATLAAIPGRTVTLGCGFVVTRENYREIFDACRNFKHWGADNVRISAMFQNDGAAYFDGIRGEITSQIGQAQELADHRFQVFDNFGSRHEDLQLGKPDYAHCGYMNFTTYIGGDQNVYTCCVNAYNERGLIGSIKQQSFRQLWDSREKQSFFAGFDARNCERCMFNEKNRVINAVLLKRTVHDNFV